MGTTSILGVEPCCCTRGLHLCSRAPEFTKSEHIPPREERKRTHELSSRRVVSLKACDSSPVGAISNSNCRVLGAQRPRTFPNQSPNQPKHSCSVNFQVFHPRKERQKNRRTHSVVQLTHLRAVGCGYPPRLGIRRNLPCSSRHFVWLWPVVRSGNIHRTAESLTQRRQRQLMCCNNEYSVVAPILMNVFLRSSRTNCAGQSITVRV